MNFYVTFRPDGADLSSWSNYHDEAFEGVLECARACRRRHHSVRDRHGSGPGPKRTACEARPQSPLERGRRRTPVLVAGGQGRCTLARTPGTSTLHRTATSIPTPSISSCGEAPFSPTT